MSHDPALGHPIRIEPGLTRRRDPREKWSGEGTYRLGGGEDGGEAEGLLEEHVAGALHLAAPSFRDLVGGSQAALLRRGGDAIPTSRQDREMTRGAGVSRGKEERKERRKWGGEQRAQSTRGVSARLFFALTCVFGTPRRFEATK